MAIAGNDHLQVSSLEIDRGGISYTVETLRQLASQYPENQWTWIIGSDSLAGFPRWREPQAIAELAELLVYQRPHHPTNWDVLAGCLPATTVDRWRVLSIDTLQIEISSTAIRASLADKKSIRYLTPRAVEKFIETTGLYAR